MNAYLILQGQTSGLPVLELNFNIRKKNGTDKGTIVSAHQFGNP